MIPKSRAARLERALAYPFEIPDKSYLLAGGTARPLAPGDDFAEAHIEGRAPVIAVGSNRSPEQLARKFGAGDDATIPVARARLADFDVVYSAHITQYGSIPATLATSPGARVEVSITWLTEAQLAVLHATELGGGNYDYVRLDNIALDHDGGGLTSAHAYRSRRGALVHAGGPVAMTAAAADGRRFPALSQAEVQGVVHARLGGDMPFEDFILDNVANPHRRRERILDLAADANPFDWPHASVIGV